METCEQLRNVVPSQKPSYTSGKYGFAEQTLDSITLVVNSVQIHFRSPVFEATLDVSLRLKNSQTSVVSAIFFKYFFPNCYFQLQRLIVDSRTPNWQRSDLRNCRLKNRETNELLLFKQIEWQTMRIEAKVAKGHSSDNLSPLR